MKQAPLRDQRGLAMVVELLLVAVVLSLVGVAVYESGQHKAPSASTSTKQTAPSSAEGLAASAAAISTTDSSNDASVSASADATADQLKDSDTDMSNLGGSTGANSF